MTRSLIESQKINALFGDKQLTQISPWINLLLSSHCSADRLPRSGREARFDQAPFLSFKPDISLIDNLAWRRKEKNGRRATQISAVDSNHNLRPFLKGQQAEEKRPAAANGYKASGGFFWLC